MLQPLQWILQRLYNRPKAHRNILFHFLGQRSILTARKLQFLLGKSKVSGFLFNILGRCITWLPAVQWKLSRARALFTSCKEEETFCSSLKYVSHWKFKLLAFLSNWLYSTQAWFILRASQRPDQPSLIATEARLSWHIILFHSSPEAFPERLAKNAQSSSKTKS